MTTPNIPAGLTRDQARAVRDYAARVLADPNYHSAEEVAAARVLLAVLPRPTLADMTANERTECQRMQADVKGYEHPAAIIQTYVTNGSARVMWETLRVEEVSWANITPRPDLPRWVWPGEQQPTPSPSPALPDGWKLADHEKYGRVVVTTEKPDAEGRVSFVHRSIYLGTGQRHDWCTPAELTFLDQEADTADTVPESTLAVGTVIESADDPRIDALPVGSILLDRNEEATTKRPQPWGWTGLGNTPAEDEGDEPGPWTVLHIPKEDDQ